MNLLRIIINNRVLHSQNGFDSIAQGILHVLALMSEINLKGTNYRLTKQRRIILEEIRKVCVHPTAESVYKLVKKRIKNISFATVYRNLDFLEKNGYIIKLKTKEKQTRYDGESTPHRHLICKKCGKIIDIFDCRGIIIRSKDLKKCGFMPDCGCLEIPGLCRNCNHNNLTQKQNEKIHM